MSSREPISHFRRVSLVLAFALLSITCASAQDKFKVLYSFKGGTDGGGVEDRVAFDAQGNLYGTTIMAQPSVAVLLGMGRSLS